MYKMDEWIVCDMLEIDEMGIASMGMQLGHGRYLYRKLSI